MNRLRKLRRLIRHSEARARTLRAHRRYRCDECRAEGVRLFRQYNSFAGHTPLYCGPCACKKQGREELLRYREGNMIYGMVAAVPTDPARIAAGKPFAPLFWGHFSHKALNDYRWWLSLPWRKGAA